MGFDIDDRIAGRNLVIKRNARRLIVLSLAAAAIPTATVLRYQLTSLQPQRNNLGHPLAHALLLPVGQHRTAVDVGHLENVEHHIVGAGIDIRAEDVDVVDG